MKASIILFFSALILAASCSSSKSPTDALFGKTWELEYITGPRIAFDGLFPDKKPQLTFEQETGKVSGTDSCNGYRADYTLSENALSFGEPGPTTMMFCGGSERQFLEMMKKIDGFSFEDDKLNLLMGDIVMMRFKSVTP